MLNVVFLCFKKLCSDIVLESDIVLIPSEVLLFFFLNSTGPENSVFKLVYFEGPLRHSFLLCVMTVAAGFTADTLQVLFS